METILVGCDGDRDLGPTLVSSEEAEQASQDLSLHAAAPSEPCPPVAEVSRDDGRDDEVESSAAGTHTQPKTKAAPSRRLEAPTSIHGFFCGACTGSS